MKKYGYDGQLGCVAVTIKDNQVDNPAVLESIQGLEQWLVKEAGLAPYAVPRFLRVMRSAEQDAGAQDLGGRDDTGGERVSLIMKKLKTGLRNEGTLSHCLTC